MSIDRAALLAGSIRLASGISFLVDPLRANRLWGDPDEPTPTARLLLRSMGYRDALIGGLLAAAALRGKDTRGWFLASGGADAADLLGGMSVHRRVEACRNGVSASAAPSSVSALGSGARRGGPRGGPHDAGTRRRPIGLTVISRRWERSMRIGVLTFVTDEGIGPVELGSRHSSSAGLRRCSWPSTRTSRSTRRPRIRWVVRFRGSTTGRLDPFVALTAAAVATEKLLVGTGIALIPQRDPILTAKEVVSLDLVSGGRFRFGVGVGWLREEIANHGVDPEVRGRVVEERLRAMIEIWTQEKAEFHGEFVNFDPIYSWPKPDDEAVSAAVSRWRPGEFQRIARLNAGWLSMSPVCGCPLASARGTAGRRRP